MTASTPPAAGRPAGAPARPAIAWGPLLVVLGVALLAAQWIRVDLSDLVVGGLMIVGGLFFLAAYRRDPATWALLVPAIALLALGAGRLVSTVAPRLGNALGGALLMGALGTAFLVAHIGDRRERWWAVIPAGALLGIAAGNLVSGLGGSEGGWLFAGLGIAFLYLAIRGGRSWAVWPAGILLLLGLRDMRGFLGFGRLGVLPAPGMLWPLALIAVGVWLLVSRRAPQE